MARFGRVFGVPAGFGLGLIAAACGTNAEVSNFNEDPAATSVNGQRPGKDDVLGSSDGGGEGGAFDPTQACSGAVVEPKRAPVDIVFSIDQSHSMADEIDRVQANINRFADIIAASGLDYRVIFLGAPGTTRCDGGEGCENVPNLRGSDVTGDVPNEICVPPPLGKGAAGGCGSNGPRFYHLDHYPYGIQSNNTLSLISGMYTADYTWEEGGRTGPEGGGWVQWARLDAFKYFVVITDDDATYPRAPSTASGETENSCKAGMTPADCWDYRLYHAKEPGTDKLVFGPEGMWGTETDRRYVYNAVVGVPYAGGTTTDGTPDAPCVSGPGVPYNRAVNQGKEHQKLAAKTGGLVESICTEDWTGILSRLADRLVARIGCEYAVALPVGEDLDPAKVLVRYVPNDGAPQVLDRVTGPDKCAAYPDAFYFDDPTRPTKVRLCENACRTIGARREGRVEVALGCKAPPPK